MSYCQNCTDLENRLAQSRQEFAELERGIAVDASKALSLMQVSSELAIGLINICPFCQLETDNAEHCTPCERCRYYAWTYSAETGERLYCAVCDARDRANDFSTLNNEAREQLAQVTQERDGLLTAIQDIDAHATPIGLADPNDPEGNPVYYVVTVGALHRALGKSGTAPKCTDAIELAALRKAVEPIMIIAREVKEAPVRLVSPDLSFQNTAIDADVWHALVATEQKEGSK